MTDGIRLRSLATGVCLMFASGSVADEGNSWELRVCADSANLPFSNREGEGFDDRIVALLAKELQAELTYVWLPDTRGRTRQLYLQAGECDLVMGVLEGQPGYLTSHAYYRTGYTFVYPENAEFEVQSLDDPALRELAIGLPGGARKLVPPALALANRGVVENQRHFGDRPEAGDRYPPVLEALKEGAVDVAIAWGPIAGKFAQEVGGMQVVPVRPEIDIPFIPMIASLTIGVRPGDEALRDEIDVALSRAWDRIVEVLAEAGVPLLPLPRPVEAVFKEG